MPTPLFQCQTTFAVRIRIQGPDIARLLPRASSSSRTICQTSAMITEAPKSTSRSTLCSGGQLGDRSPRRLRQPARKMSLAVAWKAQRMARHRSDRWPGSHRYAGGRVQTSLPRCPRRARRASASMAGDVQIGAPEGPQIMLPVTPVPDRPRRPAWRGVSHSVSPVSPSRAATAP